MNHSSYFSLVIFIDFFVNVYLFSHSCCINKDHFYLLVSADEFRQTRTGVVAENWFLPQHFAGILSVTASGRKKVDVWMSGNDLEQWSAAGRKRRGGRMRRRRGEHQLVPANIHNLSKRRSSLQRKQTPPLSSQRRAPLKDTITSSKHQKVSVKSGCCCCCFCR